MQSPEPQTSTSRRPARRRAVVTRETAAGDQGGEPNERESTWAGLYENAPVAFLSLDRMGQVRSCNRHAARLLGLAQSPESLPRLADLFEPEVQPALRDLIGRMFANPAAATGEFRLRRRDQAAPWVRLAPFGSETGDERHVAVFELGERTIVEEADRLSGEHCRLLFESMSNAYVCVSMDGRIREFNLPYQTMLGYSADELRRLTYVDLTPPQWHEMEARIVATEVLRQGHSACYEKEYRRKDGTILPVELRTVMLRDAAGRPDAMWAIVRDITERKQTQAALRLSQQRAQAVLDATAESILLLDRTGDVLAANRTAARRMGRDMAGLIGANAFTLLDEATGSHCCAHIQRVLDTGEPTRFETVRGTTHYETHAYPIKGDHDLVAEVAVYCADVTDRRLLEERLRASEAMLRELFENLELEFWVRDETGMCFMENAALARNWGSQIGKFPHESGATSAVVAHWLDNNRRAIAGEVVHEETEESIGDERRWFHRIVAPYRVDGHIKGIFGISLDITERKRAEQSIKEHAQRVRALADAAFEGIVIHDHGAILQANAVAARMFGWQPEEAIGQSILQFAPEEWQSLLREKMEQPSVAPFEAVGLRRDGKRFPIQLQARELPEQGRRVRVVAVRDLSLEHQNRERIRTLEAEEALKREQAERASFARQLIEAQETERKRIANELHDGLGQNSLAIKHQAERALANLESPQRLTDSLETIVAIAAQTVGEIRAVIQQLHPYLVERLGLTRALRAMLSTLQQTTTIELAAHVDEIDGTLAPDAEIALYRVLQEALSNVIKHSSANAAQLSIRRRADRLQVLLSDDGRGFDPRPPNHPAAATAGLGLRSMAERIALLHGSFRIQSQLGEGTRVEIELPLQPPAPGPGAP